MFSTFGCEPIGLTAVCGGSEWMDPTFSLKSGNGAVQGSGAELEARELLDVTHHGIAVFVAVREAGENEERGVCHITSCVIYRITY